MFLPIEVDLVPKKRSYKRDLVWSGGFSGGKVVLTLFTEVIILYIGLNAINIRRHDIELILG